MTTLPTPQELQQAIGVSAASARTYWVMLKHWFSWLDSEGIELPTNADLNRYIAGMHKSYAGNTVTTAGTAVRRYYQCVNPDGAAPDICAVDISADVRRAVMSAIVGYARSTGQQQFTLSNAELLRLVNEHLTQPVFIGTVGFAASSLGLPKAAYYGPRRGDHVFGRAVTPDILKNFEAAMTAEFMAAWNN